MARRHQGHTSGARYLANAAKKTVHDLRNEKPACQIERLVRAGHDKPFKSLPAAHLQGYQGCVHCLPGGKRNG